MEEELDFQPISQDKIFVFIGLIIFLIVAALGTLFYVLYKDKPPSAPMESTMIISTLDQNVLGFDFDHEMKNIYYVVDNIKRFSIGKISLVDHSKEIIREDIKDVGVFNAIYSVNDENIYIYFSDVLMVINSDNEITEYPVKTSKTVLDDTDIIGADDVEKITNFCLDILDRYDKILLVSNMFHIFDQDGLESFCLPEKHVCKDIYAYKEFVAYDKAMENKSDEVNIIANNLFAYTDETVYKSPKENLEIDYRTYNCRHECEKVYWVYYGDDFMELNGEVQKATSSYSVVADKVYLLNNGNLVVLMANTD